MNGMIVVKCLYCGKDFHTYMKDRLGAPLNKFCSKRCENSHKYERRFVKYDR